MFKVTVIPKTPGPKHQEFFTKAEDARWLSKENLYSVQWLPAVITLIEKIEKHMK